MEGFHSCVITHPCQVKDDNIHLCRVTCSCYIRPWNHSYLYYSLECVAEIIVACTIFNWYWLAYALGIWCVCVCVCVCVTKYSAVFLTSVAWQWHILWLVWWPIPTTVSAHTNYFSVTEYPGSATACYFVVVDAPFEDLCFFIDITKSTCYRSKSIGNTYCAKS